MSYSLLAELLARLLLVESFPTCLLLVELPLSPRRLVELSLAPPLLLQEAEKEFPRNRLPILFENSPNVKKIC